MDDRSYNHSRPTNPGVPNLADEHDGVRVPTLTLLRGGLPGRMFRVNRDAIVLGRLPDCDIQLDEGGVSRQHAKLVLDRGDRVEIVDRGSTNGTFVNGHRIDRAHLRDGDKVQLGSFVVLRFNYQDALDEEFQRQQFDSITRDSLTGCHNRLYFDEALRREVAYAHRNGGELAVALVDLDHFKLVNDEFGHPVGDQVLQQVATALYCQLRNYDVLARYGGEEFALLLRGTTMADGRTICERLRNAVHRLSISVGGHEVRPSVSVGVAHVSERPNDARALMRIADQRLYAAKAAGRNCVAWDHLTGEAECERSVPVDADLAREAIVAHRRRSGGERPAYADPPDQGVAAFAPKVHDTGHGGAAGGSDRRASSNEQVPGDNEERKAASFATTYVEDSLEPLDLSGFDTGDELLGVAPCEQDEHKP